MSLTTRGIEPPTPAVNVQTQCARGGCGTMLLADGTCPRCDPPMQRTTAEKLILAKHYKDPKLQRRAEAEIDAGIATGLDEAQRDARTDGEPHRDSVVMANELEELHARVDNIERRIESGFAELLGELRDSTRRRLEETKTPAPPTGSAPPTP